MRHVLGSLVLLGLLSICGCQKKAVRIPFDDSPAQMSADLAVLRAALEEGHPGLYRYTPRESLDAAFAAAADSVQRPMSLREFQILLCRLVAHARDGHTVVLLPKDTLDRLDGGSTALPFQLSVIDGQLFVRSNLSDLPDREFLGAEVLSINGHETRDILDTVHGLIPPDGMNDTRWRRVVENLRFGTRYLAYAYGISAAYTVRFIPHGGTAVRTATLPALAFDEAVRRRAARYPEEYKRAPADWRWLPGTKIAVLRIRDFDKDNYRDAKLDFPRFLDDAFHGLREAGARGLVVDLRNNRGGTDEYGEKVASHLIDHDYSYYASLRMNKTRCDFFEHTTNARGFKAPRGFARANETGSFDVVKHPNLGTRHPARDVYQGPLAVLINGASFSTTSELLSVLAMNTKAVFVGEESGGAFGGNCSGPTPTLELPHSRIRVDIPLVRYEMAVAGPRPRDRGIIPDIGVLPTREDVVSGSDPVLEAAVRWLGAQPAIH